MDEKKRVRRDPEVRRAEIIGAARILFLRQSYRDVPLVDVAEAAGDMSRQLFYRYFPNAKKDELFLAVVESVADDLHQRVAVAARSPFSLPKRMEHLLAAFFGFFDDNFAAYRLLVHDVWGLPLPHRLEAQDVVRVRLRSEIADIVSGTGASANEVLLISTGILACAFAHVEVAFTGAVETEEAWRVTCRIAESQLARR